MNSSETHPLRNLIIIVCVILAVGLGVRSSNKDEEVQKIAAQKAKEARINLKVRCPYLKTIPAAKLSADDKHDLTACRAIEAEDARAEVTESAAAARKLQATCDELRDKPVGKLTPREISALGGCDTLGVH
jgi:hypothetical protein